MMEILIFARYPVAGKCKTRLIPKLGAVGAALTHRRMTENIVRISSDCGNDISVTVCFTGASKAKFRAWLGTDLNYRKQPRGDLGARLRKAFATAFHAGSERVVVVGSDVPGITSAILSQALSSLKNHDVALGPTNDGGYYLIGMNRPHPELFRGMDWGEENVCNQTRDAIATLKLKSSELTTLNDVDRPEDLESLLDDPRFRDIFSKETLLSVIIPTLNEEKCIAATLAVLKNPSPVSGMKAFRLQRSKLGRHALSPENNENSSFDQVGSATEIEVIVADGGSRDATCDIARENGATVLNVAGGRSAQLNAGAKQAHGKNLLFLHADTLLPDGYQNSIRKTLSDPSVVTGAFRFRTDGVGLAIRLVEWGTNVRSSIFHLPYGDQGIFLEKRVFDDIGGFSPTPIMEDFDLVCRLKKRGKVVTLRESVITSARRWQKLGPLRTMFRNQIMIAGFMIGISTEKLANYYREKAKTV